mmetsp:Transcript_52721/g.140645  ORF Transcript_52721/g.140645 Transcript_52721/m.140645 type:complete len:367 (-) Transcript_52721:734-1834(-)|eukprot:CAMPEP_0194489978 /NCGR_PEP_ID=MMETSP0253-20130528/9349_1 /TAXON_ID=2966 /ORGANISM="Noctiluca scintillans" /LENGTH=366 /DNA_ID=CAMNT_0039330549 /DNA_START=130 /DNA_END=1230 /DNA_ORIENTATION=-
MYIWPDQDLFLTNVLCVVFPEGTELEAAREACCSFGDVASIDWLPGTLSVTVAFFDTRAAAVAAEAFGTLCWSASDWGSRTVLIPACLQLDVGLLEVACVCEVDDGYAFEFFDVRDAAWYQSQVDHTMCRWDPLDVELVPDDSLVSVNDDQGRGSSPLPPRQQSDIPNLVQQPCTGAADGTAIDTLQSLAEVEEGRQVLITGIPNRLLSHTMMEVVLEQARIGEAALRYTTKLGESCGEALVTFYTHAATCRAVSHFQGCQWGASSGVVSAQLVTGTSSGTLEAPCFEPGTACHIRLRSSLSSAAPAFVPDNGALEVAMSTAPGPLRKPVGGTSDVSTDAGESEMEDGDCCVGAQKAQSASVQSGH